MDENPQDAELTETDNVDTASDTAPDVDPDAERDIPHNEDLQDPAGVGTELTHDQFDLGRGARIN